MVAPLEEKLKNQEKIKIQIYGSSLEEFKVWLKVLSI